MDRITKSDLETLRRQIVSDISHLLNKNLKASNENKEFEWLRSKAMREYLNISAATLQNLRVSGKIRSRKIMGSYYYNKIDLENLFKHEKP